MHFHETGQTPETLVFHILNRSMQFRKEVNQIYMFVYYSDVTPFVIFNIFSSNCNLITFVTDYSYIYFVIKLCNSITTGYSPTFLIN